MHDQGGIYFIKPLLLLCNTQALSLSFASHGSTRPPPRDNICIYIYILSVPPPSPNTIWVKNLVECNSFPIGCSLLLANYGVKMISHDEETAYIYKISLFHGIILLFSQLHLLQIVLSKREKDSSTT